MTATGDQSEVIAFLSDPKTHGGEPVSRIDTHGAIVFLAGSHAYKLKRAVLYSYMDYSTASRRCQMCAREIEVNIRSAPEIYLGTASIVRTSSGALMLAPSGSPGEIECVTVMTRFGEEQMLSGICARGEADIALMRKVAEQLVRFHADATIVPGHGGAAATAAFVEENTGLVKAMAGAPFEPAALNAYERDAWLEWRRVAGLLDRRRELGCIRQCHGDLHLNNVVVLGGRPVLFDALEFNDQFVNIDTLYDLAFLLMDLLRVDLPVLAHALFNRYIELRPETDGLAALPLFLSLRALIRAHVGVSRAQACNDPAALAEGEDCFALAQQFLRPAAPRLLAIGGYSGTGKTTLARALAPDIGAAPGAVVLRSDVTRKRLLGADELEALPESAYAPEISRRVFAHLTGSARAIVRAGHSAIVDAVFGRVDEREMIAAAAREAGVPFSGFWLCAPRDALIERIAGRRGDASDANAAVLDRQLAALDPPRDWRTLDASGPPEAIADAARAALAANEGSG